MELTVLTDLDGIGSDEKGILKSGSFTSTGIYSLLIDKLILHFGGINYRKRKRIYFTKCMITCFDFWYG